MVVWNRTAVLWDLDRSLADNTPRDHLVPADMTVDANWDEWSLACMEDVPILGAITRLRLDSLAHQVHICSARGVISHDLTLRWLDLHIGMEHINNVKLRARADQRKGWELKVEYIELLRARGIHVVLAYDDVEEQAHEIYAATGVPVLTVNPGLRVDRGVPL